MHEAYLPKDLNGKKARLLEEIGEVSIEAGYVLQYIMKGERFGLDNCWPTPDSISNKELIIAKLGDLETELDDLKHAINEYREALDV